MTTSETSEHAALIYRVKTAMTAMPPEDLTADELHEILTVLEVAVDRSHPPDLIGNVVWLAGRRRTLPCRRRR
ncbi:MAG TPA: hypothetical protein VMQ38_13750 [Mycobacterium sp.]|jgi:hypothetical protein|nr:hypothetical protein [Mycobacterium sp.]